MTLALLSQDPTASPDLAELALQLACDEYPAVDVAGYLSELDAMAHEVRQLLQGRLLTRVRILCRYLFHELGFEGNSRDYYDPRNSYLNEVLDRRVGLPITLSLVALSVGQRAGMNVDGVGLPGHFIAKAVDRGQEILFDPFHAGRVLTPSDCEMLVRATTGLPFEATPPSLAAASPFAIVQRMLTNLKGIYLGKEDFPRAARVIGRLRQLTPEDVTQRRDLGATLIRAGQPGKAMAHLEAYLAELPDAEDEAQVRRLLSQARSALAQWN